MEITENQPRNENLKSNHKGNAKCVRIIYNFLEGVARKTARKLQLSGLI